MGCDSWKAKLDTYLDGELPAEEMRPFAEHVRGCPTCAADALARVQMKRSVQAAGKRRALSAETAGHANWPGRRRIVHANAIDVD